VDPDARLSICGALSMAFSMSITQLLQCFKISTISGFVSG
jgi:hypothetical protein